MVSRGSGRSGGPQLVEIGGRRLRLTNLDKVLYPETGTTKADVIGYYSSIAPHLLPFVRDRPATRKRWVHGVGTDDDPGEVFFQKNLDGSTPDWVARVDIEHSDHHNVYPLVNDEATLAWFAQIASLEIHVPQWRVDSHGARQNPDRLVLDLDPGPGTGLAECVTVARSAREFLQGMGLEPVPVTSGSKGLHLYAALDGSQTSDAVSEVAHELARVLEADHPDLVVSDMKKAKRGGRVLVDWSQNSGAKTTIAPYSLRGRAHPTVAVPRTWEELDDPELRHLEYSEVLDRMQTIDDPLAAILGDEGAVVRTPDRLTVYRSKRDGAKTPEPVPEESPAQGNDDTFVVQDHHARGHHHDFRLERDGVLVSWALPKGVPDLGEKNRLAVQTEDHPLDYASFEGRIPTGEYGAGTVTIWDAGTYVTEKWRDDEIIVTLDGRADGGLGGRAKIALIRTKAGGDPKNWLFHRMELEGTYTAAEHEGDDAAPTATAAGGPASPARRRVGATDRSSRRLPSPMLATRGSVSDVDSTDGDWAFEMKWDGIRCIARIEDGGAVLGSRNGLDLTATFPDIAEALAEAFPSDVVLDAEIVALEKGRPVFSALQNRLGITKPADVARAMARIPATVMVFDVLEREGEDLTRESYTRRRAILDELAVVRNGTTSGKATVQIPPALDGDVEHAVSTSKRLGLEGVVAKRTDSVYRAGRRSRDWIKLVHEKTQEVVIVGWRPGNNALAESLGSLLVAVPDDSGALVYAGRVGTGFTDSARRRLRAQLDARARKTPVVDVPRPDADDAEWVRADLVGEVTFADWTGGGRLRHPVWRGLRPDRTPADVTRDDGL
ncbi:ATP-dependent DNA ligase LigD ligase module /ATP-dependent DNA ligase LigD phosphoesterase module /ATP-dependent DNA ligase LigD polymerase module [Labedella gwakjiensis]|uniref:DNA ligase (ATP) n=1 Tax=Labedella gwakjiensis TaxID=390269 RepID=A0A2P8GVI6_9MICO|nr:ATP-dependent DNA ligase [Labedella gwakjiensis]PSL37987.1 ATP-dependent DNA ligase LigD ligase module /ATP-dependent DNA ligase LigD phosphoesterase module /ATP-dependent DNA ligase LigD polymerase module [Labedella gwakjiensis]RUQ87449.1 ATP-dependent DNA ligase [Labedella gwakjiensis]